MYTFKLTEVFILGSVHVPILLSPWIKSSKLSLNILMGTLKMKNKEFQSNQFESAFNNPIS